MARALNIHAVDDNFVLKSDKDKDTGEVKPDATYWSLGAMDSYDEAYVSSKGLTYDTSGLSEDQAEKLSEDEIKSKVKVHVDYDSMAIEAVALCLRGWRNFIGSDGNEVVYRTKKSMIKGKIKPVVHPDCMAVIPKNIINELYQRIQELSTVTEEQAKNSG